MGPSSQTDANASTDRISVVLATFNGARYLREQLLSIANQTRLPDEMIVVDDASSDDTVAILNNFRTQAPFPIDIVGKADRIGTCEAFGEALQRATGDVLMICDQDDRWMPEKVAVMAQRMAEHQQALLAFSDAVLINTEGRFLSRSRWRVAGFGLANCDAMVDDPFGQMMARQIVSGCTAAIRREILPALLPFPTGLHPALGTMMYDRWISLLGTAAAPIITVPERLVEYRIHPTQQIGIPALPIRRVTPRAALRLGQFVAPRVEKDGRFAYLATHIDEIQKRLVAANMDSPESSIRLRLAKEHLLMREKLPASKIRRTGTILHHYIDEDGYRRFSLGWASALSDLVR